jgi:hypothetical protein
MNQMDNKICINIKQDSITSITAYHYIKMDCSLDKYLSFGLPVDSSSVAAKYDHRSVQVAV